jgi:endoplasmic reticulum-Golgi intermediate compartment protein 3
VTIISGLLIAILVLSELSAYRTSIMKPELVIDKGRKDKLPITFNVTFPKIPCYCKFRRLVDEPGIIMFGQISNFFPHGTVLNVDIMDDSGQHLSGFTHDVYKVRLDLSGNHIETEREHSK